jgi:PAS domain S-box-containing protein
MMSKLNLLNDATFRLLFDQSPTPQIIYHPDGQIIHTNPATTELLNFTADELSTMNIKNIIVPLYKDSNDSAYLSELADISKIERSCKRKDQTTLHAKITVHGLTESDGSYIANVGIIEDISELQEWRYWFQILTHDIAGPIHAINSIATMLVKEDPPLEPDLVADLLGTLYNQSKYAREVLQNIHYHRENPIGKNLQRESVNLDDFLRQIWIDHRPQAQQKQIDLVFKSKTKISKSIFNPVLMRQALSNLIDNAIKYTPNHGKVTLSTDHKADELIFSVSDTGLGIPKTDIENIFTRYFRVETPEHQAIHGTGLGLSIIKAIIEQHEGRVWVESELGKGSTFFIALPTRYNGSSMRLNRID